MFLLIMAMPIALGATLAFTSAGRFLDGRWGHIRAWWLLALPVVAQVMAAVGRHSWTEGSAYRLTGAVGAATAVMFVVLNWSAISSNVHWSAVTVLVGLTLNLTPRLVFGGMPYLPSSALTAGYSPAELSLHYAGHVSGAGLSPVWLAISDIIPIPGLKRVASVGDVLLVVGLACIAAAAIRASAHRSSSDQRSPITEEVTQ